MGFRPGVSRATVCPLGQPDIAIGLESQIEPWLPKSRCFEVPECSAVATSEMMRNIPAVTTKILACAARNLGRELDVRKTLLPFAEGEVFFLDIPLYRTPLFGLQSAQKVFEVAPARHLTTVTVFLPRACRDVVRPIAEPKQP